MFKDITAVLMVVISILLFFIIIAIFVIDIVVINVGIDGRIIAVIIIYFSVSV